MPLRQTIAHIRKSIPRFPAQFAAGRERRPPLQAFASAIHVVNFLRKLSAKDHGQRPPIVAALVEEHRASRANLWQAMLVVAFEPLLCRVRYAFDDPNDEDIDQMVLLSFLEALSAARLENAVPVIAIECEMFTALTRHRRGERTAKRPVPVGRPPEYRIEGLLEVRDAVRILLDIAEGDQEIVDVVLDTVFGDEKLTDHVARVHPDLHCTARALLIRRLHRKRARIVARMNARLTGGAFVPTQTTG